MTCSDNSNKGEEDVYASIVVPIVRLAYSIIYGMMVVIYLCLIYCARRTLNRLYNRYLPHDFDNRLVHPALKTIAIATAALLWPLSLIITICICIRGLLRH